MHRDNIHQRDVLVDPRFSVDVATFAWVFALVRALAELKLVTGEFFRQVGVDELLLRVAVIPEDDLSRMTLCRVVHGQTRQLREDLPGYEVVLAVVEDRFRSLDIVRAVLHHSIPVLLVDRLVPRDVELHVENAQLDLELLQAHLLG